MLVNLQNWDAPDRTFVELRHLAMAPQQPQPGKLSECDRTFVELRHLAMAPQQPQPGKLSECDRAYETMNIIADELLDT